MLSQFNNPGIVECYSPMSPTINAMPRFKTLFSNPIFKTCTISQCNTSQLFISLVLCLLMVVSRRVCSWLAVHLWACLECNDVSVYCFKLALLNHFHINVLFFVFLFSQLSVILTFPSISFISNQQTIHSIFHIFLFNAYHIILIRRTERWKC